MYPPRQTRSRRRLSPSLGWLAAVILLVGLTCGETARADEKIWSALLLASNSETPKKAAPEVARLQGVVERFFGYNQILLIGSATKTIDADCERWLVPSQNFWLGIKAKKGEEESYRLDVTLFHDKRRLVETQAKLGQSSPLIIRGPLHARGQLLIVLQVLP